MARGRGSAATSKTVDPVASTAAPGVIDLPRIARECNVSLKDIECISVESYFPENCNERDCTAFTWLGNYGVALHAAFKSATDIEDQPYVAVDGSVAYRKRTAQAPSGLVVVKTRVHAPAGTLERLSPQMQGDLLYLGPVHFGSTTAPVSVRVLGTSKLDTPQYVAHGLPRTIPLEGFSVAVEDAFRRHNGKVMEVGRFDYTSRVVIGLQPQEAPLPQKLDVPYVDNKGRKSICTLTMMQMPRAHLEPPILPAPPPRLETFNTDRQKLIWVAGINRTSILRKVVARRELERYQQKCATATAAAEAGASATSAAAAAPPPDRPTDPRPAAAAATATAAAVTASRRQQGGKATRATATAQYPVTAQGARTQRPGTASATTMGAQPISTEDRAVELRRAEDEAVQAQRKAELNLRKAQRKAGAEADRAAAAAAAAATAAAAAEVEKKKAAAAGATAATTAMNAAVAAPEATAAANNAGGEQRERANATGAVEEAASSAAATESMGQAAAKPSPATADVAPDVAPSAPAPPATSGTDLTAPAPDLEQEGAGPAEAAPTPKNTKLRARGRSPSLSSPPDATARKRSCSRHGKRTDDDEVKKWYSAQEIDVLYPVGSGWGRKKGECDPVLEERVNKRLQNLCVARSRSVESRKAAAGSTRRSQSQTPRRRTAHSANHGQQVDDSSSLQDDSQPTPSLQLRLSQAHTNDMATNADLPQAPVAATPLSPQP